MILKRVKPSRFRLVHTISTHFRFVEGPGLLNQSIGLFSNFDRLFHHMLAQTLQLFSLFNQSRNFGFVHNGGVYRKDY
jgi:hypothetical protein